MDDGMRPLDDPAQRDDSDEPTQPLPVIRPNGHAPLPGARHAEVPPLPPSAPRWPLREQGYDLLPHPPYRGERPRRFATFARALQAAHDRQLSLGCSALAAIVLLGALVLAALGGNFAGLADAPFVPHPNIQAAPLPPATALPTPTATPRPTPTPSPLPSPTATPAPTPTPIPTATPAPSPTPSSSPTPNPSPSPTPLPSPTPSPLPSPSPSPPIPSPSPSPYPNQIPVS